MMQVSTPENSTNTPDHKYSFADSPSSNAKHSSASQVKKGFFLTKKEYVETSVSPSSSIAKHPTASKTQQIGFRIASKFADSQAAGLQSESSDSCSRMKINVSGNQEKSKFSFGSQTTIKKKRFGLELLPDSHSNTKTSACLTRLPAEDWNGTVGQPYGQQRPPVKDVCEDNNAITLENLLMSSEWQNRVIDFEDMKALHRMSRGRYRSLEPCLRIYQACSNLNENSTYSVSTIAEGSHYSTNSSKNSRHRQKNVSFSTNVLVYTY